MKPSTNNTIEISKSRILSNIETLKQINSEIQIAPVLKSNAYGHGIEIVAPLFKEIEFPFYCVYSLEEAEALRSSGITTDILIMGGVNPEDLKKKVYDFTFAAFDQDYIKLLNEYQPGTSIHIYVDTGLHREGINFEELIKVLETLKEANNLSVTGLMSHFACSNDPYCELTAKQIRDFKQAKQMVLYAGFSPKWFHFGGALALINAMTETCNVIRCGKALFGIGLKNSPSAIEKESVETKQLLQKFLPTLKLKTKLIQIKDVKPGEFVGYVETFRAEKPMKLGILPIGYFDGVDRRLSNKGYTKVGDVFCPIVGMVSMNATIIDISGVQSANIGDEVIVFSWEAQDQNSLDNSASLAATIPQDLLVHLQTFLPRNVVE